MGDRRKDHTKEKEKKKEGRSNGDVIAAKELVKNSSNKISKINLQYTRK